jgi:hypothetical protein
MGPADLDDVFPLLGLNRDPVMQCLHSRNQPLLHVDRAAMYIAEGKESLDDCAMLTWSLG